MAKQITSMAVPSLRFPEFRNGRDWVEKSLKDICTVNPSNDGLPKSFFYIDLESVEGGTLKSKSRVDRENAPSRAQRLLRDGDVIFQIVRPYQRNNFFVQISDDEAYVASTGYAQLRANNSEAFLYQIIHSDTFVQKVIAKCTGSNYPAINSSDLGDVSLFAPQDDAEQQKIADCLTSLDEVIAAQGRKVEALKAHKRGLMQQLFPREGETRPRLRFPVFCKAPEWEVKKLSALINLVSGTHLSPNQYSSSGNVPYFTGPSDFTSDVERVTKWTTSSSSVATRHDTLITVKGSGVGECWYLEMPSVVMGRQLMAVRPKGSSSEFIHQFLLTKKARFEDLASGNLIPGLSRSDILDMVAPFPKLKEQQRIADCLSSLDAQIIAESNQLATLKTHKQGLMQQLFPAPEAASA